MKMALGVIISLISFLILVIAWSSYPWSIGEKKNQTEILHLEPDEMLDEREDTSVVKILTWNLGFLYGKGSEGPGYEFRDRAFYEDKLKEVVKEIKDWNPDILFLQEIDLGSKRSHEINQAEYIAIKAGYPYVAEAVSWEANYIPFPYWPLSRNFGKMRSGGAIISRYPLTDHEVVLLHKPMSQPWWYNLFYLHRYLQKVNVTIGEKSFKLINLHLEAFDKVDRQKQVKKLIKIINEEKIDFVAGDFNTLPRSATKKTKFENGDDYENDKSYELMMKSGLSESIPDEIYSLSENTYFTFPSWRPDRRLDYIFFRPNHKMMKAEVLPSSISDHLPLRSSFQVGSPTFNPFAQ